MFKSIANLTILLAAFAGAVNAASHVETDKSFMRRAVEAASDPTKSTAIKGTYNTTFLILPVPESHARSLLPASFKNLTFIPANTATYPTVKSGQVPLFLELGREMNAGPPGLNFLSFQEAKVELLQVKRVANSSTPFMYKHRIFVDDGLNAGFSQLLYGLNTSVETFNPAVQGAGASATAKAWSNTKNYAYEAKGKVKAILKPGGQAVGWEVKAFRAATGSPWFGDNDKCAAHSYAYSPTVAPVQTVVGNVTLYPPFVPGNKSVTYRDVRGVRVVIAFNISAPAACQEFA